jgi:hypothetical protein
MSRGDPNQKLYSAKHRRKMKRLGLCGECGIRKISAKRASLCRRCGEKGRKGRRKLKRLVINTYGGVCVCCRARDIEFLTLEHSRGDGQRHRASIPGGAAGIYRWLKKLNFPKNLGLLVLCMNCNFSKGHYGYCPHQRRKRGT